jgi:hypothetical protein
VSDPSESSTPPDWAVERARAALKGGMSPSEVEWRLVGLGLTRAAAAAAVNSVREPQAAKPDEARQGISPEPKAWPIRAPRLNVDVTKPSGAPPGPDATAAGANNVQEKRVGKPDESEQGVTPEPNVPPISAPRLDLDVTRPAGAPPGPDWPAERARAALNVGMSVPDVERQLVGKGLSPEEAAAVVRGVLEERLRTTAGPRELSTVELVLHRTLSMVFGVATVLAAFLSSGVMIATYVGILTAVAVGWIWRGRFWRWVSAVERPSFGVRLAGWVLLGLIFLYRLEVLIVKILYLR